MMSEYRPPQWASEKSASTAAATDDERLVLDFLAELCGADIDKLAAHLAEDAMYHNMPLPPAYGKAAVLETLSGLFSALTFEGVDTFYLASRDGFVFTERVDHVVAKHNGKSVSLPVAGVLQVADGKIKAWRDYFDLRDFEEAVELPLRG